MSSIPVKNRFTAKSECMDKTIITSTAAHALLRDYWMTAAIQDFSISLRYR
ncbi:hypothetical protein [Paenibacillus lactis]|uniref:hypothetical protein n=1 Tax=Paenibacillus lactis TaxID=228574 RepID=UPI001BCB4BCF|nr:hypothetical protein [Paenibacillus lactis]